MTNRIDHEEFPNPPQGSVAELIKRRRLQILVHSCLYYELDNNIISDEMYDKWAIELEKLMKENPGVYSDRFDMAFSNWDSSSGFDLPLRDPWVIWKAKQLLKHP